MVSPEYIGGIAIVVDLDGKIVSISQRACELLEYEKQELMGINWLDTCVPVNLRKEIKGILRQIIEEKMELSVSGEMPVLTKSGATRNFSMRYSLLNDHAGNVSGILFFGHEITERKNIEAALKEANDQLVALLIERTQAQEQLMRAKMEADFYLDLMSHDLTNYNQNLLGNLTLLERREKITEAGQPYIDACKRQVAKSENLIFKVRAFSRVRQMDQYTLEPVSVNSIIMESLKTLRILYPRKKILVSFSPHGDPCVLATDLFDHVIMNILENAVKYTTREPVEITIEVRASREAPEHDWEISVADNGIGVSGDMKEKIFDRFLRINTEKKGTGLGLSLSKAIVTKFGGSISVEDRVKGQSDKGSKFIISMPRG